jgi:parallel beta-helix repeat protein
MLPLCMSARAETNVGGVICANTTWNVAGSPYIVTVLAGGSIVVGCGATLTIQPGVEVRFEPGLALLVGWSAWGPGTLVARGTEQSPILFTSNQPAPAPGDWSRIAFLDLAADAAFDGDGNYVSGCILEHVIVEHAGSGDYAAISVSQSAPYLNHCEVRQNLKRGMGVYSAPPLRIASCYVHDNHYGGMFVGYSGNHVLAGNTVSDNWASDFGGGIYFESSGYNMLVGNTISGNQGISDGGGVCCRFGGNNTLLGNVVSGNSVLSWYGGGIELYSDGNVVSENVISGNYAPGRGGGIYGSGEGNTFNGNIISGNSSGWGGGLCVTGGWGLIVVTNNQFLANSADTGGGVFLACGPSCTFDNNTIEDNTASWEAGGLYVAWSAGNAPFVGNVIRFNHTTGGQAGGIFVASSEWLSFNGGAEAFNTICGNDGYEVYNNNPFYGGDGRYDIDARNVLWGTDDTAVIQAGIYDFFDDSSRAMVLWYPFILPAECYGDLNCDGMIDFADINPFVLYLSNIAAWQAAFAGCNTLNGDINCDGTYGQASFDDINPFVALMGQCAPSGGCPCPGPITCP